jgi:isocitrate dehydrogenase (NAD+)
MSILKNGMKLLMNRSAQNALGNKCLHTPSSLDAAKAVGIKSPIARAFASGESNEDTFSNLPVERITCTLIPGDGVYPELMNSVQTVLKAIGAPIDFETILFSEVQHSSSAKVEDVIKSINRNRICLMGALMSPDVSYSGELQNLHMKLRKGLDLYSNVVHVVSWPGVASRHKNIDMVIIRELTEGEYSALEHESVDGVVECLKIVTASKSQRIAKFAFDYAIRNNRERVTCVHKANIMKLGDGLFLKSCAEIRQLYPGINFEAMIVDNCTMQMVSNPQQFDILVMPNLYGNILDNLAAGLVGGAGVVASSSFSPECAVFEPGARHVFQTAVGKNIANPTAMLMCASKMLRHVNLQHYSESIRNAIREVLAAGKVRTRDLGGSSSTHEFTEAVIKAIV